MLDWTWTPCSIPQYMLHHEKQYLYTWYNIYYIYI